MRIVAGIIILILFPFISIYGQTVYTGSIDKYPIELAVYVYGNNDVTATYLYTEYNIPIQIDGRLENKNLQLFEKNEDGLDRAVFLFKEFDNKNNTITGTWTDFKTKKEYTISLTKKFGFNEDDDLEWDEREILQSSSIGNKYFRLVTSKSKDDFYPKVAGIKILEKGSSNLLQKFDVDCQLMGLGYINVDDYNFDGYEDFSIFEASYTGPNTTSLYFLYDLDSDTFFESEISGISLTFDPENKLIYEHNQCCAGRSHTNTTYKVVDNKMVVVKQTCIEYDEEKEDFVESDCS